VLSIGPHRITRNDNGVADLERVSVDTVSSQLAPAGPLNRPPFAIRGFDVNEGVRITEQELDHFSFDLYLLAQVVCARERMVGVRRHTEQECTRKNQNEHFCFHNVPPDEKCFALIA